VSWSEEKHQTERSFSAKWRRATNYRKTTETFYIDWYLQRYGFKELGHLQRFLSDRRFILDAGTGTGRDAKLYAENSGAQVFGIDISEAADIAYKDLKDIPNLHLIRADLTRPPFRDGFFDFISCDQVLHHTPDPKSALGTLLRCLKRGAPIAVYLYKKKDPIREFCDDHLRRTTTEMTDEECYRFAESITKFGKALSGLQVKIEVPEKIPLLGIEAGTYDLQRFFHWKFFKCFWNDQFDYETNVIINFDWYHPKHAYRYTEQEVRDWCLEMNLKILHFDAIESGISVLAIKE
jgi:ubiquinone/menaquinone biosynthesis C-methylase UbiE